MSRLEITETADTSTQMLVDIAPWTQLDESEVYDPANKEKFARLIETAREKIGQSFVAAALVSAWDSQMVNPYDYDDNANDALRTAEKVMGIRDFFQEHPEDEMGLHLGEYHLILFRTDHAKTTIAYDSEHGHHAYISIHAPLQTNAAMHSGEMSGSVQQSIHGQDYFGGSQGFSVGFNELKTGVTPRMQRHAVEPLILGRDNIAQYFDWQGTMESAQGGTTNRLNSLAYAIWRLRAEDEELAAAFQATADKYGLEQLWTGQYRQEIGAKAAHVVLRNMLTKKGRQQVSFQEQVLVTEGGIFNDEPDIYGTDPDLYMDAARRNAERVGASTNETKLRKAIQYVFKSPWE